ncbi:efflux RND transporter periplasmic adaptor subunit [Helicobacter mustelae]|uniref:Putative HlyD family secretion protein n=1 Tax=Helicobacter mustelae (strain ATCC 43772 / CCUG 25715 / CIP 103759 / LMG 18044 / NCTC 12198 / R85-136P) TaxID=679897 RepID=D3UHP3_HELM1|nr:efflux RND transporter periplasmic adaptor subunit [Helicobacter mustelae]CBG40015.1 putative HlyD family secretion protein [Helicobacter mustelae 12198]SQH71527.1 HlyD family secretion protein [Helicobacter mustelae]STP12652.1 HlyD family secretion protein [Helicobacter mustelae]
MKLVYFFFFLSCVLFTKPIAINTQPIKLGTLEQKENFIGSVLFKEVANIASQSSGAVEEVYFELGQRVKKGERLIRLNDDFLQKDIIIKQAKLTQAQYILENKKKELERYENLLKTKSVALQQYENIQYEVKMQESNILALQTELEISKLDLAQKIIYAPFDGVIVDQKIHQSEWIRAGETICQILNTKDAEVVTDVPSFMVEFLKLGQRVQVKIRQKIYLGKVSAIIPRADRNSRNFPVYISIKTDDTLLEGMSALISLNVNQKNTGFLIPRDSIVQRDGRPGIFVVRDAHAVLVPVEVLSRNRDEVLVKGALKKGERVVSRGQDVLQNGSEVRED